MSKFHCGSDDCPNDIYDPVSCECACGRCTDPRPSEEAAPQPAPAAATPPGRLLEVMCAIAPRLVDPSASKAAGGDYWAVWCKTYAALVREMAEAFIAEADKSVASSFVTLKGAPRSPLPEGWGVLKRSGALVRIAQPYMPHDFVGVVCNCSACLSDREARLGHRIGHCDDCNALSGDLITKGDHHGNRRTVCRDRDACHRRSPG